MPLLLSPVEFLAAAVNSYTPFLQPSGEMGDPVFGEPTQYGTAYHSFCNAVLATCGDPDHREIYFDRATRGLDAALSHTTDPSLPANASGFDRATGAISRGNHRDFTWPPILKTHRLLRDAGSPRATEFAERIADLDIEAAFRTRPPSNWASVWLSGEWIRHREGLSPYPIERLDEWLGAFFVELILVEQGLYQEPGLPNSYDLFTRYHLADMLVEGYDGRWRQPMEQLLETGLQRSLAMQLSDGSLASAHRSTGQTWTLGAQIAYFTHAARWLDARDTDRAAGRAPASNAAQAPITGRTAEAEQAAWRAYASFARWQRANGPYSPVENVLPPGYRVGYERYTADGHYANLALAFLAVACLGGLSGRRAEVGSRAPSVRAEHEPTSRAIAHHGRISLHVNACPATGYDGFGITDLTVGPGRLLHFASSVRHAGTGALFNLGLAHRDEPGRSPLAVIAQEPLTLTEPIQPLVEGVGLQLQAKATGEPASTQARSASRTGPATPGYALTARIESGRVTITESTPGLVDHKTLLVPYLRDPGGGTLTEITTGLRGIRLLHGTEQLAIDLEVQIDHIVHFPYGYENRRGLCGLVRIDLQQPSEGLTYHIRIVS